MTDAITLPAELKPADGRFGAGPSKVGTAALDALAATGTSLMGTSHRQAPVKKTVGRVRDGLGDAVRPARGLRGRPRQRRRHEAFWDIATFGLIREKSQHLAFGEFSGEVGLAAKQAPFLAEPTVISSDPGSRPAPRAEAGVDAYAWAHNETSTAVMAPVRRVEGADPDALVLVDATSGAGGLPVDLARGGRLLLRSQKCFASDGGLWISIMSPAALARAEEIAAGGRLDPGLLRPADRHRQLPQEPDLQHPSVATLFLMAEQLDWMNAEGGLEGMVRRTRGPARTRSTAGRRRRRTRRRTSPTRTTARSSSAPSTSTRASTPPRSPPRCAPTAS